LVLRGEALVDLLQTLGATVVLGLIANAVFVREPVFAEEHQVIG
jgi:hypothetical protein